MAPSSFDALRPHYPDLFDHLSLAENLCEANPRVALASVRMFAEDLTKMLAHRHGIQDTKMKQPDRVRALEDSNVVPAHIAKALNAMQRLGSKALHDASRDKRAAEHALTRAQEVMIWIVGPHTEKKVSMRSAQRISAIPRPSNAWAIRPYPHYKDRRAEFIRSSMIAVGWPMTGDLRNIDKTELLNILKKLYPERESRWLLDRGVLLKFRDTILEGDLAGC